MDYDLKGLRMIAQGGEAELYELDEKKVLRVTRQAHPLSIEKDRILHSLLADRQIDIPAVYEYCSADGRQAVVMQRISGCTMLDEIRRHPLRGAGLIRHMAGMQSRVFDIEAGETFTSIRDMIGHFAEKAPLPDPELMDFVLGIFHELPSGGRLCHGDFHPGNLLKEGGRYYVIDWSGAYRSSCLSDIAHTYLLLTHVPTIPGESAAQHAFLRRAGKHMAQIYLGEIRRLRPFDDAAFSKWTVVMAYLRHCFGLPDEKMQRLDYLNRCLAYHKTQIDPVRWYLAL